LDETFGTTSAQERTRWLEKQDSKSIKSDRVLSPFWNLLYKGTNLFCISRHIAKRIYDEHSKPEYIPLHWGLLAKASEHYGHAEFAETIRKKYTIRALAPQPWRHLHHVLWNMGHYDSVNEIGIQLQEKRKLKEFWLLHSIYGALVGYGYKPKRLIFPVITAWVLGGAFYWWAALPPHDVFAPTNPLIFQDRFYRPCLFCHEIEESDPNATRVATRECYSAQAEMEKTLKEKGERFFPGNWYLCPRLREEYTGFSPLAYSLDVLLPLVDLQQQKDWGPLIPTPKANPWDEFREDGIKHLTRLVIWFQTLFGWVASLLLVAIVSGLTKRRED
jgi:hypothetical protein